MMKLLGLVISTAAIILAGTSVGNAANVKDLIHGTVKPGFEEVYKVFEDNFKHKGEIGAAIAVYWHGEKVVDLWGGYRIPKTKELWKEDTMVPVFSTTKGMTAMVMAHAQSRGLLDYDTPIAKYWPEFAANGKGSITVRQLLDHSAGLVLFDGKLPLEKVSDHEYMSAFLARQKPSWVPGEKHGYHLSTLGLYVAEIIRRVDPKGRSLGKYFDEEIARPLDLDFYIGLPDSIPTDRLAKMQMITPLGGVSAIFKLPFALIRKLFNPTSTFVKSFSIPVGFNVNRRSDLKFELGSGSGVGTARALAAAYSEFAMGGKKLGIKPATIHELEADPETPKAGPKDEVLGIQSYFHLGFSKNGPKVTYGASNRAYGTPGAGGSFSFADPDNEVGYSYVMNKQGYYVSDDPRENNLRKAVYNCIARQKR